jgi:hypothetical protein
MLAQRSSRGRKPANAAALRRPGLIRFAADRRITGLALAVVLGGGTLAPSAALAQLSLSLTSETDHRVRGVSLSGGKPSVRLGAAYDHPSGVYGGAAMLFGRPRGGRPGLVGHMAYLGYAKRLDGGLTVDLGANRLSVRTAAGGFAAPLDAGSVPSAGPYPFAYPLGEAPAPVPAVRRRVEYSEVYAGVLKGQGSAHVYLSPDYFGGGSGAAYVDLNASVRPARPVRLFAHAGLLAPLSATGGPERYDLRAGAALELRRVELQLAWSVVGRSRDYLTGYPLRRRHALVFGASAFF